MSQFSSNSDCSSSPSLQQNAIPSTLADIAATAATAAAQAHAPALTDAAVKASQAIEGALVKEVYEWANERTNRRANNE